MPIRTDAQGIVHIEVMVNRRRIHRRLAKGTTARDAKRIEAELISALGKKQPAIPGDPYLTELMAHYMTHADTLRSPETAKYHALRIGAWVEGYKASEARQVAAKIIADMKGHYAAATINRSLGTLKKALSLAWDTGRTPVNYSTLVKRLPEHNARTTWLTIEQVQQLVSHCSKPAQAAIWIALFTGCRRGEVCKMRAADIGATEILIHAGNTKTEKARTVPIIAPVRPWLEFVPLQITEEGIKSAFRRAREAIGMPHIQFRDLRRSCGTLMIQNSIPLHVVSRILGHSSTAVTERVYAHLANQQMHDGLNVLTGLVGDSGVEPLASTV